MVKASTRTAILTATATALITIAQALGLKVTTSTGKTATVAGIVAALSTIVHFATQFTPKVKTKIKPTVLPAVPTAIFLPMFDTIEPSQIPANPVAVAGYVNGNWPTYASIVKMFAAAHHLSITVTALADADCLDVETGDATPGQVAAWVNRQHSRGLVRPVIYSSLNQMSQILSVLKSAGIPRQTVKIWTAHYTHQRHICTHMVCGLGAPGDEADATQWTNLALGRNLDESLCTGSFFT